MAEPFGVAILGLDHWYIGLGALDVFKEHSEFPLLGVADPNEWRREDVKGRGVARVTGDFNELLEDERVRVVFAMMNSLDNETISRRALEEGKHVLCVKPPAMTVDGAKALTALAERQAKFFGSFECMGRFGARRHQIKDLIQSGMIGVPTTYCRLSQGGLPMPWAGQQGDSWWLDPAKVPGGAWIDHAIYAVDEVRDLFGTEITSVQATMENRRYPELKVEDYGIATFHTASAMTAVVEDAWLATHHSGLQTIIGQEGSLHLSGPAVSDGPLLIRAGKRETLPAVQDPEPAYVTLCRRLRDGEAVPFTGHDSVANLAACLGAYASSRGGRRMDVGR